MGASWGEFFYRAASILAGLILVVAIINYLSNVSEGLPTFPVAALLLAGAIWLIGYICRNILTAR
jgi:hypothetical protein